MTEARPETNQTRLVEQVLALTEEIDHAARIADWQRAALLSEQRSPLLMSFAPEQSPEALALIRRIQALDDVTLREARTAQSELANEYRTAMDRTRAANSYNSVALMR
ncbi:protein FliT [Paraburkholderia fungorum]|uniref:Flagellar protein FliT n=1 Tax=Paraburkholderia fungorum TaxID=134537 RepID=A0A1H0YMC7_9BURK|nr:flagellar protein FliT [Paraburkholderia fungorum]SDQ16260.1 protein FliT [Paraburkholderia fungorum]